MPENILKFNKIVGLSDNCPSPSLRGANAFRSVSVGRLRRRNPSLNNTI
ncbi:MAG: hypothetical protein HON55_02315 [Legionellales bacterium]|nr:hypothetical protein [Legionellales bacterium]